MGVRALEAHWSDTIIWAKDRFTLGRADYQRQYEPIWYGWPEGRQRHWAGGRDQGDVWQIPEATGARSTPCSRLSASVQRGVRTLGHRARPRHDRDRRLLVPGRPRARPAPPLRPVRDRRVLSPPRVGRRP